jgi:hypothetical protein
MTAPRLHIEDAVPFFVLRKGGLVMDFVGCFLNIMREILIYFRFLSILHPERDFIAITLVMKCILG